jgi:hypothetical protein
MQRRKKDCESSHLDSHFMIMLITVTQLCLTKYEDQHPFPQLNRVRLTKLGKYVVLCLPNSRNASPPV